MVTLEANPQNKLALGMLVGFIAGILWLIGFRTIALPNPTPHYHANFAVYINGQREKFDSYVYYEEVAACTADKNNPKSRVHMHDNVNHVVHVHDKGVTWSALFSNLGYSLGNASLETRDKVYVGSQDGAKLSFVLNGQIVSSVSNRVIGDEDRLLINFGPESDSDLLLRYKTVEHNAGEVDALNDPAACSGNDTNGLLQRLKRAAWQSE